MKKKIILALCGLSIISCVDKINTPKEDKFVGIYHAHRNARYGNTEDEALDTNFKKIYVGRDFYVKISKFGKLFKLENNDEQYWKGIYRYDSIGDNLEMSENPFIKTIIVKRNDTLFIHNCKLELACVKIDDTTEKNVFKNGVGIY